MSFKEHAPEGSIVKIECSVKHNAVQYLDSLSFSVEADPANVLACVVRVQCFFT